MSPRSSHRKRKIVNETSNCLKFHPRWLPRASKQCSRSWKSFKNAVLSFVFRLHPFLQRSGLTTEKSYKIAPKMTPRSRCWSQLRPSWLQLAPKWPSKSTQIPSLGLSWRGSGSKVDDQACKTVPRSSRDPLQATIFTNIAIENHSIQSKIFQFSNQYSNIAWKPRGRRQRR